MLEIETILSDRYFKPPYGGNGGEWVKLFLKINLRPFTAQNLLLAMHVEIDINHVHLRKITLE